DSTAVTIANADEIGDTIDSVPISNARYTNTSPSTWQIAVPARIAQITGVPPGGAGRESMSPTQARRLSTWIEISARGVPMRRVRWVMRKSPSPQQNA